MRYILLIISLMILLVACKGRQQDEAAVLTPDDDAPSLVNDRIYQVERKIDSFVRTRKNPDQIININNKVRDVKEEVTEANTYLDKWKERLMEVAGRKSGQTELVKGNDTGIATRLMVKNASADTLRWHVEEVREIFLKQVRDTQNVIAALPPAIETSNRPDWNRSLFEKTTVYAAITMLNKIKIDITSSELIVLNKIFTEAKK